MQDFKKHRVAIVGPANCIGSAPINQNQHDALLDFALNVGVPKFCGSTLAKRMATRDYAGAAAEFPKWRYGKVKGQMTVLPGLVKRREKEVALFQTPSASRPGSAPSASLRANLGIFGKVP